jgi:hypothetical protein
MELADAHADALRRVVGRTLPTSSNSRRPGSAADVTIVIRPNRPEDDRVLARLAARDSAAVPAEPLLLAEADGELRAALSLRDGRTIADPFHRTASYVALLTARAEQLCGEPPGPPAVVSWPEAWEGTITAAQGVSGAGRAC